MVPPTAQVLGFFNLFVGSMLMLSVVIFIGGFIIYLVRLGTWPTYRTEALALMGWGLNILYVLVVLLAIQQFLAHHLLATVSMVAAIIIGLVLWVVIKGSQAPPKPPERP